MNTPGLRILILASVKVCNVVVFLHRIRTEEIVTYNGIALRTDLMVSSVNWRNEERQS